MNEKKTVLVIEDDKMLRDIIAEKLEKSGYLVDRAEDGVVGMDKIRTKKPDLILLDILMPRKGGIEVMEEIHADPLLNGIPVIIISNSGQPVEIARARELGAQDFLIKAVFDPKEVIEKVGRVLGGEKITSEKWGARTQDMAGTGGVEHPVVSSVTEAQGDANKTTAGSNFVLVVEDDKFLRELLAHKLVGEGFNTENAIDATATFAILAERKPKLILLDLILPGMDGFEILTKIKADPKTADIPVIILSNLGQKEDTDKAMALGAKDFMVKANFTLDEIVTKVRGIVG